MNHFKKVRLILLCHFFLLATAGVAFSQNSWQLGLGVGYTNYYGDLSYYRVREAGDFYKLFRFLDYNKYYQNQPSFSLLLEKRITPTLGLMIQANHLQFSMSDRYREKNGSFNTTWINYPRSLNFQTTVQDAGIAFTFNTNNGKFLPVNSFFYPSFYLGAGVSSFRVKGDLFDATGAQYNYNQPGNIMDGDYETNLRDVQTETAERFRNVEPYADLGLALNFRFSDKLRIAIQSDIKYSASDYLDDVSGMYKSSYATPREQYIARPGYNTVNPVTMQRGDDDGVNDFYINNRIVFNVALTGKPKPKAFKAPVIYSLSTPFTQKKDTVKSGAAIKQDSLLQVRIDSLTKAHRDSLQSVRDSVIRKTSLNSNDSNVQKELQLISGELREIKNILKSQETRPRYQQLQYQVDSVAGARSRLMQQKSRSREDNLRLRIYDLQVDSLNYEMERLQNNSKSSGYSGNVGNDIYVREQRINSDPVLSERSLNERRYESEQDNTLRSGELRTLDNEVKELKEGQRYRTNASYKRSVDSLQRRLDMQRRQQIYDRENFDRDILPANQARADSLIRRLNELEAQAQSQSAALPGNRTVEADTAAFQKSIGELETRMKQNADSVALLQRQLKYSSDSAAYYRRVQLAQVDPVQMETPKKKTFFQKVFGSKKKSKTVDQTSSNPGDPESTASMSVSDSDTVQQKKSFIKTIFQSEKSKQKEINERQRKINKISAAERNTEQQRYYDADAERLRASVDQIEKRNRELANEYERMRSERDRIYRERQSSAPAVIYQRDYSNNNRAGDYYNRDYNEILSLREELSRLRGQVNQNSQQPVYVPQSPVLQTDTSQVNTLRSELDYIRHQLDSMRTRQPVVVERPVPAKENFDVNNFPVISVYFKTGSTILSGDQVSKIGPFGQLASRSESANIVLKGFADPVGNPVTNQAIARKRTDYVKNVLITRYKIPESRISLEEPEVPESGSRKANPLDRRVDLRFD